MCLNGLQNHNQFKGKNKTNTQNFQNKIPNIIVGIQFYLLLVPEGRSSFLNLPEG